MGQDNLQDLGLLTDLYELTMAQTYFERGMGEQATFSLIIRSYPANRGYFVSAGLQDVLAYLEGLRFSQSDLKYLESTGIFSPRFLDFLGGVRFTGDVWAIPEGRLFFANEPILEVTAPIIQAQIVESFIINQVNLQSIIATKASRCVWASRGREVVDFSLRRTHGADAGMKVARSSYIAGASSTSNVLAAKTYSIPPAGTMAHSLVTCFPREIDAFRAYVESFPDRSVLLVDTYDTIAGAQKAAVVGKELEALGHRLQGVRLDSGDLGELSRQVRRLLDDAGLGYVRIVGSGGLDEMDVQELVDGGAPIDSFGIGTTLGVSADAPWTDMAYKLVRYGERPVIKLSAGKESQPDPKQVYRTRDGDGIFAGDIIALRDEQVAEGDPLLEKVMDSGRSLEPQPSLDEIRGRFTHEFAHLGEEHKDLHAPVPYNVSFSPALQALYSTLEREIGSSQGETGPGGGTNNAQTTEDVR
ncbi:MAG: nicotinate phosphoribosyltransferase [Dehalococcoidia bacterium]|nr:nicotinate phosphoribosyltransferase [Dehalococcoidia bacterium]